MSRPSKYNTASLCTVLCTLLCQLSFGASETTGPEDLLPALGQNAQQWSLPLDAGEPDEYRLPLVEEAMRNPWRSADLIDSLATLWLEVSPATGINLSCQLLGIFPEPTRLQSVPAKLEGLPKGWPRDLVRALSILAACFEALPDTCVSASSQDIDDILFVLLPMSDELTALPCELAQHEGTVDRRSKRVFETGGGFRGECLARTGQTMSWGLARAAEVLRSIDPEDLDDLRSVKSSKASGDVVLDKEYPWGSLLVGGIGTTIYTSSATLMVDLGGDDIYLTPVGASSEKNPNSMCLDLSGDDFYSVSDTAGIAAGIGGVGIVLDVEGNDVYRGGDVSLGVGIAGIGMLFDLQGDDIFSGGNLTQGAAVLGAGILADLQGNDLYDAGSAAQGFGYVGGAGVLFDSAGSDRYLLGSAHTDILRYEDHALAMGQGFGFGHRPTYSGGIGLLIDAEGNDTYRADIFGQGASYWYSLGGLVDFKGNDVYAAYQYVQGAGVHLSVAALVDREGNDSYSARGVSQGCGHDLAVGYLKDHSGDDSYVAYDLSQGAGSANGIGILDDGAGNDSYSVIRSVNSQGYGNRRRHYGSLGLLWDRAGDDVFSSPASNEAWQRGLWGFGWDREDSADSPSMEAVVSDSITLEQAMEACGIFSTCEALFIVAARGEPRFAKAAEAARESLLAKQGRSIPCLLDALGSQRPRDPWTLEKLFRGLGSQGLGALLGFFHRAGPDADPHALATGLWIIGRMLEHEGDSISVPEEMNRLFALANHKDRRVRSSLAYVLAESDIPGRDSLLLRLARDSAATVRLGAVRGLERIPWADAGPVLLPALEDSFPGVAHCAATVLAQRIDQSASALTQLHSEQAQLALLSSLSLFPEEEQQKLLELWATSAASDLVKAVATSRLRRPCEDSTISPDLRALLSALGSVPSQ